MSDGMPDLEDVVSKIESIEGTSIIDSSVFYEEDGLVEFALEGEIVGPGHPRRSGR